jgi:pilus assembly protein Flp/PilA
VNDVISMLRSIVRDRRAVTALEYGLIAGVLGLALITVFTHFGSTLSTLFKNIGGSI